MACILNQEKTVKNGQIIKVWNTERKVFSNAAYAYYALWVQEHSGDEVCLLFTEHEYTKLLEDRIEEIQFKDKLTFGKSYKFNGNRIVIVNSMDEDGIVFNISNDLFERALERAAKNAEDQPEKSWFTDNITEEI